MSAPMTAGLFLFVPNPVFGTGSSQSGFQCLAFISLKLALPMMQTFCYR